jgi:N-acetylmuramic acid 6-phosphate etherase
MSVESSEKARKFLSISSQFMLGRLVTESSHPDTRDLSQLAVNDPVMGVRKLKTLDDYVVSYLTGRKDDINYLRGCIKDTLDSGGNIFFCGCGATGRLSLTIETLWRQKHQSDDLCNRVSSFMAGGDVALIRSIENFEDFPSYGARQLDESGFKDGDLLIGTTEGGETPFVIGAVERATELSHRKPFFLYCNPDDILSEVAERSARVINNKSIEKINLTVGPMAVTGSTRMQSSTILLAVAGIPLLYFDAAEGVMEKEIDSFSEFWVHLNIDFISGFLTLESDIYKKGEYLLYESDNNLGITVLTDTTERSPTFSLLPFENSVDGDRYLSLCYLMLKDYDSAALAWEKLLWREPRTLEWDGINGIASGRRLLGFDFSANAMRRRQDAKESVIQHVFAIKDLPDGISMSFGNLEKKIGTNCFSPVFKHLLLKMILNTHSTLVMGRLNRYEGNVMTYLRASNNKLIDRAIRYIDLLLSNKGIHATYEELCEQLFATYETLPPDKSIVMAVVAEIQKRKK